MFNKFRESLISMREAAKQLQIDISTVFRWVNLGVGGRRLPSVKIGGRRYIRISDLAEFLSCTEKQPGSEQVTEHRNQIAQQKLAGFGVRKAE